MRTIEMTIRENIWSKEEIETKSILVMFIDGSTALFKAYRIIQDEELQIFHLWLEELNETS